MTAPHTPTPAEPAQSDTSLAGRAAALADEWDRTAGEIQRVAAIWTHVSDFAYANAARGLARQLNMCACELRDLIAEQEGET